MNTGVITRETPKIEVITARLSIGAAAATLLLLVSLHMLSPAFDPSYRMVSEYALGQYGWVLSLMFLAWGISAWALAVALWSQVHTRAGKIGLWLLVIAGLGEVDQEIREAYELIQAFTTMRRERKGECLDAWLQKAEERGIAELKSFAQSLKRDYDAVKAGLTLIWSQGPVEGHVHRLKLIKRQAYGRASFEILHKRVLPCA